MKKNTLTPILIMLFVFSISVNVSGNSTKALIKSVINGDLEQTQQLISDGEDVNSIDKRGYNLLMLSVENGHFDVLEFLLDQGADLNQTTGPDGYNAFSLSIIMEREKFTRRLLEAEPDLSLTYGHLDYTAAMLAAARDQRDLTDLLINRETDLTYKAKDGQSLLSIAIHEYNTDLLKYLISKKIFKKTDPSDALLQCIYEKRIDMIPLMLKS